MWVSRGAGSYFPLRAGRAPLGVLGVAEDVLFLVSQLRRAAVFEGADSGIDFFAVVRMNPTPPGEVSIWLMRPV